MSLATLARKTFPALYRFTIQSIVLRIYGMNGIKSLMATT